MTSFNSLTTLGREVLRTQFIDGETEMQMLGDRSEVTQ